MKKIAVCPGSFDPITNGHLDIIRRTSLLFDEVKVVVMFNFRKTNTAIFSVSERMDFISRCTGELENVSVESYTGLLAQYAAENNASVIVKGLRAVTDFEDEFQQALANKRLNPRVETIFMPASAENMFLSSSVIKQICALGGDVEQFLPPQICADIIKKLRPKTNSQ